MRINYEIDHLRTDYHFSFSIYKVKNKTTTIVQLVERSYSKMGHWVRQVD